MTRDRRRDSISFASNPLPRVPMRRTSRCCRALVVLAVIGQCAIGSRVGSASLAPVPSRCACSVEARDARKCCCSPASESDEKVSPCCRAAKSSQGRPIGLFACECGHDRPEFAPHANDPMIAARFPPPGLDLADMRGMPARGGSPRSRSHLPAVPPSRRRSADRLLHPSHSGQHGPVPTGGLSAFNGLRTRSRFVEGTMLRNLHSSGTPERIHEC